jgi:hypothetical protein
MLNSVLRDVLVGFVLFLCLGLTHNSEMVDGQFRPVFDKFVKIAKECDNTINTGEVRIEMDYSTNDEPFYAVTYYLSNLIRVKYIHYRRLSPSKQEQTIMHELGHLSLNLRHNDEDLNLMNTKNFIPRELFENEYDYFIRKLFWECKAPLTKKFIYE